MKILEELNELVQEQIINQETADRIRQYAATKKTTSSYHRLLVVFGVLGATLVGLGIILLLAYNWDNLPRWIKVVIAFLPLIAGQWMCGYLLFQKSLKLWYAEAVSVFTSLSAGLAIAMVHQVYNLPENSFADFLMLWLLLALPTLYLLRSRATSILYIVGVIVLCLLYDKEIVTYIISVLLFLFIVPFYFYQIKHLPKSRVTNLHHLLSVIFISVALCVWLDYLDVPGIYSIYIIFLAGMFLIIGKYIEEQFYYNAYKVSAILSICICFFIRWKYSYYGEYNLDAKIYLAVLVGLYILGLVKYILVDKKKIDMLLFYPLLYGLLYFYFIEIVLDISLFVLGVWYIWKGMKQDKFLSVNFGLLLLSLEIGIRFFDSSLSFVIKGIVFILLGLGFFIINGLMLKSKKNG